MNTTIGRRSFLKGSFNATGPDRPTSFADYLAACGEVTGGRPDIHWLDDAARERFKVTPDETPQWAPHALFRDSPASVQKRLGQPVGAPSP